MFLNGYALHEEPCTDPYARFCGQTEASASSDPIVITKPNATRDLLGFALLHPNLRADIITVGWANGSIVNPTWMPSSEACEKHADPAS